MLHAPDFLGYPGAMELARDHREIVERGLALRRTANAIMATIGGRAVHPVNVRVGGFYRVPSRAELEPLAERLRTTLDLAVETVRWVAGFEFPDYSFDHEMIALHDLGATRSSGAACHQRRPARSPPPSSSSTLWRSRCRTRQRCTPGSARPTAVGCGTLPDRATRAVHAERPVAAAGRGQAATAAGLGGSCRNPFRSIVVRAVEVVCAIEEAIRLIAGYEPPAEPFVRR